MTPSHALAAGALALVLAAPAAPAQKHGHGTSPPQQVPGRDDPDTWRPGGGGPTGQPGTPVGVPGARTPPSNCPPSGGSAPTGPWTGPADGVPGASPASTPGATTPGAAAAPAVPTSPAVPVQVLPGSQWAVTQPSAPGAEGSWLSWWQLHGERYLERQAGPATGELDGIVGAPRPEVVHGQVLPALLETLRSAKSAEVERAAMTAIARIGGAPADHPGRSAADLGEVLRERLASSRVETVEDAALALGILGDEADAVRLAALIEPEARLTPGSTAERVPARLRAFAAYGLGLLGRRTQREDVRRYVAQRLWSVAREPRAAVRDVPIACVLAYGLVPLALGGDAVGGECDSPAHCREGQVHGLLGIVADGDWDTLVRAHALTAAAGLAMAEPVPQALREEVARAALEAVRPRSRERRELRWSAVLALGRTGDADGEALDADVRDRLEELVAEGKDLVERTFAVMALAEAGARAGRRDDAPLAGADDVRRFLARRVGRGTSRDAVWSALALGVHGRALSDAGRPGHADTDRALAYELAGAASPLDSGAYALALGLRRAADAGAKPLGKVFDDEGNDLRRGFAALGLGLMAHRPAVPRLAEVAGESLGRPELHVAASYARGLCGDPRNPADLAAQLADADARRDRLTLATSIGRMGDERAVAPLLAVLASHEHGNEARAAAAQALGELCDSADAPWYRALADGLNYLAAPGTLLGAFGALDRR